MAQIITSIKNPIIKNAMSLHHKKYRKLHGLAVIEGKKIIQEAIKAKVMFASLFIDEAKKVDYKEFVKALDCEVIYTNTKVIEALSPTKSPQGVVAVIKTKNFDPIVIATDFLILDHIQDPGNLGAIIRSAAASGFKNIFMLNCVDIYNDKVMRASMGNVFKTNNYNVTLKKLSKLLLVKENYELLLADMSGENIFEINLPKTKTIGIIIGNEGVGVSREVRTLATKAVKIPMQNGVESLNAAVSASIIMYNLKH